MAGPSLTDGTGLAVYSFMIRRKLSVQLALVMLVVALLPLLGAGLLTLHLLERSVRQQAQASREQAAETAAALVRDYLKDATTKLSTIARLLRKEENPQAQTRRLNSLLDPPDIFLEVSYWTTGTAPVVQAQVQQSDYNTAQNLVQSRAKTGNRAFQDNVGQYAQRLTNDAPLWTHAVKGQPFVGDLLEIVESFPALPISVPAPGGAVTANVDFRPVAQLLATVAGSLSLRSVEDAVKIRKIQLSGQHPGRTVMLIDGRVPDTQRQLLSSSRPVESPTLPAGAEGIGRPINHADWWVWVYEPAALTLAPVDEIRRQVMLWFVVAVALAAVLAFTFAGRIVLPLRALAGKADAFGRGNFHVRSEVRREDEIGQLAAAFDRMAGAVQELDRLKDDFVSHVSHELRTPLTSAKMTLANVQEGLSGVDTLGRVQGDLDRLIRMVNELLDVAKIESGLTLEKRPTDLGTLARATVDTLRPLARVALEVRGPGATVDADPARLQQILLNLVDNALKYAKSRVDVELDGRSVRVTDDGPGVPPEHREAIFKRFAKVETGPKPPGAGLGLSIARSIAELHGGTLVCEGNTFVLKL
jgi:signal transduction histidine kinase